MFRPGGDQAEGLRRMLSFHRARTISVVGGRAGVGTTSCVINLAAALARAGRSVVILDEHYGPGNVSGQLGVHARFDLRQAISGDCTLEQALIDAPHGIRVLAAANGARLLPRLTTLEQARAVQCFAALDRLVQLVLIDARSGAEAFACAAQETILVVSPSADSIIGGYAQVKRAAPLCRRFRILVNRARGEHAARQVFENMAEAARHHLQLTLEYVGSIAREPAMVRARAAFQPVIDAFPASPSASSLRRIAAEALEWPAAHGEAGRLDSFMQRVIVGGRRAVAGAGV